jgi:hypothetical protein
MNPVQSPKHCVVIAAPVSTHIIVLGGGVGGLAAARHLERLFRFLRPVGNAIEP